MRIYPTQEEVHAWFDYEPETGLLRWKAGARYRDVNAGKVAGFPDKDGYTVVGPKRWLAHRLIWIYVHNWLPARPFEIDHKDGIRDNNRLDNLRIATRNLNNANARKRRGGLQLPKGVEKHPYCYTARIKHGDRRVYLGSFKTVDEAQAAYIAAAREMFGEFARAA